MQFYGGTRLTQLVLYYLPPETRIVLLPRVLPSNIPNGQVHTHANSSYANYHHKTNYTDGDLTVYIELRFL